MNIRRILSLAAVAAALTAAGCGDDDPTPRTPEEKQAAEVKEHVVYQGEQLLEFDIEAPASVIERVASEVCGDGGFDTDSHSDYGYGHKRLLVTCRAPQPR